MFNPRYSINGVYHSFLIFKRHILPFLTFHCLTPFIFLSTFGIFGARLYEGEINSDVNIFVLSGFFAFSGVVGALTHMTYGFYRDIDRGFFHGLIATKATLPELFLGRCIWASARTLISSIITLSIGSIMLDVALSIPQVLLSIFIIFSCNLFTTTMVILFIAYFIYHPHTCDTIKVVETPMVAFSGVFIPTTFLPNWLDTLAHIFPLYHSLKTIRALWTNESILPHLPAFGFLCLLGIACFLLATRKLKQRIIS